MDLIITILPVATNDLPISPRFTPYSFLSRCKFSALTTRQPLVEFYLLTFPRFPLRKKEHKSCFGENRTHDLRTSRYAAYLLDHSGDERLSIIFTHMYLCALLQQYMYRTSSVHSVCINTTRYIVVLTVVCIGEYLVRFPSGWCFSTL